MAHYYNYIYAWKACAQAVEVIYYMCCNEKLHCCRAATLLQSSYIVAAYLLSLVSWNRLIGLTK